MSDDIFTPANFDKFREEARAQVKADEQREKRLRRESRRAFWRGLKNGFLTGLGFRR